MDEIWKPVVGYEELYEVSNLGRVRSLIKRGQTIVLKPQKTGKGYLKVDLWANRQFKKHRIHHLVLSAFECPRPADKECDHINRIKTDNRLANLRWVTRRANRENQREGRTKLDEETVRKIALSKGKVSIAKLSAMYGVHANTIQDILKGRTWKHVTGFEDMTQKA